MQARARGYVLTLGAAHAARWRCPASHSAFSARRAAQYARSWKYAPPCSSAQRHEVLHTWLQHSLRAYVLCANGP